MQYVNFLLDFNFFVVETDKFIVCSDKEIH